MLFFILSVEFNINNLYFIETNKSNENELQVNKIFIRFIYSTPFFSMNNICIQLLFRSYKIEKYYNKCKCIFSIVDNEDCIQFIQSLEQNILTQYSNSFQTQEKTPLYKLSEQIHTGEIKLYHNNNLPNYNASNTHCNIILKISGIWNTDDMYGITYKYLYMKNII